MRAYISFILVFVSLLLLLSVFELTYYETDQTKAIIELRTYSFSMNMKEVSLELLRQGARDGFEEYDRSHDISLCKHCIEYSCLSPPAPNYCDPGLCSQCFKEPDARASAEQAALSKLETLNSSQDFDIHLSEVKISTFTAADQAAKNRFKLSNLRIDANIDLAITSEKFDVSGRSKIPHGVIIAYEQH